MQETCPICLDDKELIPLETCSHGICSTCIVKTLRIRNSCPVCRKIWCPDTNTSWQSTFRPSNIVEEIRNIWINSSNYSRTTDLENKIYHSITNLILENIYPNLLDSVNTSLEDVD